MTFSNRIRASSQMLFPKRAAKTAACNSRRGIVNSLSGATLDFAATNLASYLPLLVSHLTYAHAAKACLEALENTHSIANPTASTGVRQRGNVTPFNSSSSLNSSIHFWQISGGNA